MKLQDSLYKPFQHWAADGKIYIISDTHFGETQIYGNEYDEYTDEERIAIINKGLSKNDTLIHLGDVGDVEKMKLIKPCYKVLLLGNHDAGASKYLDFFDEVYEGALTIGEKLILSHVLLNLPGYISIHGHDHSNWLHERPKNCFDVNLAGNIMKFEKFDLKKAIEGGLLKNVVDLNKSATEKQKARKKIVIPYEKARNISYEEVEDLLNSWEDSISHDIEDLDYLDEYLKDNGIFIDICLSDLGKLYNRFSEEEWSASWEDNAEGQFIEWLKESIAKEKQKEKKENCPSII